MSDRHLSIYSLYIINKAGGLIYQKDFSPVPKLSTNDYLRLASTFHSLHAITGRGLEIHPLIDRRTAFAGSSSAGPDALPRSQEGMQSLEAKDFRLQCYQTLTGIKFLIIASPNFTAPALEKVLQQVYQTYVDYVLKNPFYELEMPIRIEYFDTSLAKLISANMTHSHGGTVERIKER